MNKKIIAVVLIVVLLVLLYLILGHSGLGILA